MRPRSHARLERAAGQEELKQGRRQAARAYSVGAGRRLDKAMYEFFEKTPDEPTFWRGIVLFGQNVASYKFALAGALLELGSEGRETVPLSELSLPFANR